MQVVVPKEPDADPMLNRLRTFSDAAAALPVAVPPDEISVRVVNGSGHAEWGTEVLDGLVAHGFHGVGKAETGDRSDYPLTQIRWNGDQAGKALTAASYLGTGNAVQARPDETGAADLLIIVGKDWGDLVAIAKRPPDPNTTRRSDDHKRRRLPAGPTTTGRAAVHRTAVTVRNADRSRRSGDRRPTGGLSVTRRGVDAPIAPSRSLPWCHRNEQFLATARLRPALLRRPAGHRRVHRRRDRHGLLGRGRQDRLGQDREVRPGHARRRRPR